MNTINLFISHSWKHNNQYEDLISLLKDRGYFDFKNYSVPSKDPLDVSGSKYKEKLREAIKQQMQLSQVVIIIAGKYVTYSDSIQMELELAAQMGKPIIAVRPWGANQISTVAENAADDLIGWNSDSIVEAIRRHI